MNNSARTARVAVSADGRGLVSQAGAGLLWETMRVTGLARGLSQNLARWRAPRAVHDPGKIVADPAAAVALGGDCLADTAVLREQPQLAGPVASDPVVSRHDLEPYCAECGARVGVFTAYHGNEWMHYVGDPLAGKVRPYAGDHVPMIRWRAAAREGRVAF